MQFIVHSSTLFHDPRKYLLTTKLSKIKQKQEGHGEIMHDMGSLVDGRPFVAMALCRSSRRQGANVRLSMRAITLKSGKP